MGQIIGFARASTLAVAAALAVMAMHASPVIAAQKTKPAAPAAAPAAPSDEAAQAQKNAEGVRRAYDAGIKAFQAGSLQPAVDQLSTALRGGGLPSTDMARALYTRGLAYKKQSKPGLAISDLTSALWLKNGLADADRQTATAERAEAYRMAGLGDGNTGTETVAVADPNKVAAKAAAAVPSKTVVVPAPIPGGAEVTRQAPDSQAAIDAANARKNAAAQVDGLTLESAVASSVTGGAAPRSVPAPVLAAETAAPAVTSAAPATAPVLSAAPIESAGAAPASSGSNGPSSTIAGFFSNLFSGGSAAAKPDGGPVTTASTTPATPATSSWSDQTSVASGNAKPVAAAKTVAAAAPAAKPVAAKAGKYKVHIAAVRSRAEAESLAQTLATKHGPQLKSGTPLVDEAVIGSMGTFYRVRVGSYVNADEPRGVCNALRTSGFDCLVVTN